MNNFVTTLLNLQNYGGEWLGKTREWLQSNVKGGDRLTWDSNEPVSISFCKLQELGATGAAAQVEVIRNDLLNKLLTETKDLHIHLKELQENPSTEKHQEVLMAFGKIKGINESIIVCYKNDSLPTEFIVAKEEFESSLKMFLHVTL